MTSGQYSQVAQLSGGISPVSSHQRNSIWPKTVVYSISCSCGKIYKGETCCPLKVKLEEHQKAVVWGEIEKSRMVDYYWSIICMDCKMVIMENQGRRVTSIKVYK